MFTREAVQSVIALVRTAHNQDLEGFELLMPDTLEDAQRLLSMSIAVLDAVTAGPKQDQVLNQMIQLAEGLGDGQMPEPDDEPDRDEKS